MVLLSSLARYYQLAVDATKELIIRVLMGVLIFLGYVLLSLFTYAIIRRIMVPQKLHIKPVHLYFNPECHANVSPSCPFPQAEFLLNGGKKLLSSGQYYTISLELELPESPVNEDVGVFMVNITFYTTERRFLSTSARPAMVHYRSPLLQTMSTLLFAVPLMLGYWEQKQTIDLLLYENYYEPYGDGSLSALVSIFSHRIQLYSASLTIEANFSGFTYYLYQWPISMSAIVVISIFITLCTCTMVMWVRDVIRDYDQQRRRGLQRRQILQQQQQQQQQRQQQQRQTWVSRRTIVAPPPPSEDDGTITPSSEASRETLTGVEDLTAQSGDSQDPVTPSEPEEEEGSYLDTESDVSAGFNEVISNLQTLHRDIDGSGGGRSAAAEGDGVRQRTS